MKCKDWLPDNTRIFLRKKKQDSYVASNQLVKENTAASAVVFFLAGGLAPRWNQIEASLRNTHEKLVKLGFTYYNDQISIISADKEDENDK